MIMYDSSSFYLDGVIDTILVILFRWGYEPTHNWGVSVVGTFLKTPDGRAAITNGPSSPMGFCRGRPSPVENKPWQLLSSYHWID